MNYKKQKIWIQIAVWLSLYIFFFSMSNYFHTTLHAALNSIVDIVSLLFAYLFTVHFLFPKYYKYGKEYIGISFLFIIVYTFILLIIDLSVIAPYMNHLHEDPPLIFPFIKIFMGIIFTFFVGTSVRLIQQTNRLKENEKLLIEEKLKTELKLLKAQINPHFIFNALNNIYSLTYMESKNAPESVLKLSEMLRYVFYDCSKDKVPITSEINYIENFNAFQQMKSEYIQNINLKTSLSIGNVEIAPMLFIPFIENAFKYSRIEELEDAYVKISVTSKTDTLLFCIENNVPKENKPIAGSGTGIKNVKHRLNIIYPEKYSLDINENDNKYNVKLSIKI